MGIIAAASAQTVPAEGGDPGPTVSKSHPVALSINYTAMIGNAPPGNCGCFLLNGGSSEGLFHAWKNLAAVAKVTGSGTGNIRQSQQGLSLLTYMAVGRRHVRRLMRRMG